MGFEGGVTTPNLPQLFQERCMIAHDYAFFIEADLRHKQEDL